MRIMGKPVVFYPGALDEKEGKLVQMGNRCRDCGKTSYPADVQSILIRLGADRIPMYTVENACASGSSTVRLLFQEIALGAREVGMALGVESLSAFNRKFGKELIAIEMTPFQGRNWRPMKCWASASRARE